MTGSSTVTSPRKMVSSSLTLTFTLRRLTRLSVTGMAMSGPEAGLKTMLPLPLSTGSLNSRFKKYGVTSARSKDTESTVGGVVSAAVVKFQVVASAMPA